MKHCVACGTHWFAGGDDVPCVECDTSPVDSSARPRAGAWDGETSPSELTCAALALSRLAPAEKVVVATKLGLECPDIDMNVGGDDDVGLQLRLRVSAASRSASRRTSARARARERESPPRRGARCDSSRRLAALQRTVDAFDGDGDDGARLMAMMMKALETAEVREEPISEAMEKGDVRPPYDFHPDRDVETEVENDLRAFAAAGDDESDASRNFPAGDDDYDSPEFDYETGTDDDGDDGDDEADGLGDGDGDDVGSTPKFVLDVSPGPTTLSNPGYIDPYDTVPEPPVLSHLNRFKPPRGAGVKRTPAPKPKSAPSRNLGNTNAPTLPPITTYTNSARKELTLRTRSARLGGKQRHPGLGTRAEGRPKRQEAGRPRNRRRDTPGAPSGPRPL